MREQVSGLGSIFCVIDEAANVGSERHEWNHSNHHLPLSHPGLSLLHDGTLARGGGAVLRVYDIVCSGEATQAQYVFNGVQDSFGDILLDLNSKAHDRYPVIDREELGSRRIVHSSAGIQQ